MTVVFFFDQQTRAISYTNTSNELGRPRIHVRGATIGGVQGIGEVQR